MTSIEWLIEQIGIIDIKDPYYAEIFEQAKEMHKQEIIDAKKLPSDEGEKWFKIFSPMWNDGKNTTRYEITYISEKELNKITDYKILEEYSDKDMMLNSVIVKNKMKLLDCI